MRPFHEAEGNNNTDGSGAWFWWGSGGAEVYKKLWRLLYTTLTEKYGIHNVIWEINLYTYANSYQWYPGDDCVDMVAYDKYEGSPYTWKTSAATTAFLTLVNDTKDTKMVALSENNVIPDIKNITNEGAWWLYFCPWYGEFLTSSKYNDPVLLNTIYNSQSVITLDELPANMYGMTHIVASKKNVPSKLQKTRTLLLVNNNLSKQIAGAGNVYSLSGKKIEQLSRLCRLRTGVYITKPQNGQ